LSSNLCLSWLVERWIYSFLYAECLFVTYTVSGGLYWRSGALQADYSVPDRTPSGDCCNLLRELVMSSSCWWGVLRWNLRCVCILGSQVVVDLSGINAP
jgi:hypothetical protein